jgi:hypothetical protein
MDISFECHRKITDEERSTADLDTVRTVQPRADARVGNCRLGVLAVEPVASGRGQTSREIFSIRAVVEIAGVRGR